MASLLIRCLLFLSSYTPLLLILAIRIREKHPWYATGFGFASLVSTIVLYAFLSYARLKISPTQLTVECASSRDAEAMSYIASYVIPFLVDPFADTTQAASLSVFFLVLGAIYINSNMIHINPMLSIAGLHVLEVEAGGQARTVITRKRFIARDTVIRAHSMGDDILLEAR